MNRRTTDPVVLVLPTQNVHRYGPRSGLGRERAKVGAAHQRFPAAIDAITLFRGARHQIAE